MPVAVVVELEVELGGIELSVEVGVLELDGVEIGDGEVDGFVVAGLGGFEVSVAAYPEVHPEAPSAAFDLDNLKRKVEAGAVRAITQYCFETDTILRFRDAVVRAGIACELVPGIMPIHSFSQIRRFSAACGAGVPGWLADLFDGVPEGSALHGMIAATVVGEQVRRLAAAGFGALHVYALNRAELPLAIVQILKAARQGAQR